MTKWSEYLQQSHGFKVFIIINVLFITAIALCMVTERKRKISSSYVDKWNIPSIRKAKIVWFGMLCGFFVSVAYAFVQMSAHVGRPTSSQELGALFFGLIGTLVGALVGSIIGRRTVTEGSQGSFLDLSKGGMAKISSTSTSFYKRVFPIFWFGFLIFFIIELIRDRIYDKAPLALIIPCIGVIFGFLIMRKLVWDLADDVFDCGDFLLVKKNDIEEKVELKNIMNVSVSLYTNPKRITLTLVRPGELGSDISFTPEFPFFSSINPLARSQIADDLIVRVDQARTQR